MFGSDEFSYDWPSPPPHFNFEEYPFNIEEEEFIINIPEPKEPKQEPMRPFRSLYQIEEDVKRLQEYYKNK